MVNLLILTYINIMLKIKITYNFNFLFCIQSIESQIPDYSYLLPKENMWLSIIEN